MAADCVNVSILGGGAAGAASRDLPTASATIDTKTVDAAIEEALAKAGPAHNSTAEINKIALAVSALMATVTYGVPSGDVNVMWNSETAVTKTHLKAALREAMRMIDSEAHIPD